MAKYLIKIPTNCTPEEADRWRAVSAAFQELTATGNKVNAPNTGLSASAGKAKINQYDTTAEYLDKKIVEGNDIDFVESNDGLGSKKYTVHLKVAQQATAPTSPTTGMLWRDTDAINNPAAAFVVVTNTYTVADEVQVVVCNKTTAFTVTLPEATASGRLITIANVNTGTVTVSLAGDTIDGEASQLVYQWDSMQLIDHTANTWKVI